MNNRPAQTSQKRTALALSAVVATMVGASFAAVPFYDWFCRVTGFGGTTLVSAEASSSVTERDIVIRFDASRAADMPWEFKPALTQMQVKIGENGLAFYEAYNPTDQVLAGTASYNVAPYSAGGYFVKVHCFCFEQQILQPGERVSMPVSFFVDPAILDDDEAKLLKEITLSYTFHLTDLPEGQADAGMAASTAAGAEPSAASN